MPFDPSNVCARTAAGDAELARPTKGLALAQRKLLAALDAPLILDELATRYGVENARLIRDLEHLATLGLVVVHGAGRSTSGSAARRMPTPVPAPAPAAAPARVAPRRRRSRSRRVVMLLLVAAIMATGIVLLGRSGAMPTVLGDASPPPAAARAAVVPAPSPGVSPPPALAREAEPAPALAGALPVAAGAPVDASSPDVARPPVATAVVVPATPPAAPVPPAPATPSPSVPEPTPSFHVVPLQTPPTEAPRTTPTPQPVPAVASPAAEQPAPPVVLAVASPSSPPAERPAARPLVPITQEAPPFPRDAIHTGTRQGTVRARLTLDAAGRVTNVAIVESQPRRVFDRAVLTSLASWTYEPGAPGRTTEVEVAFRRD